MKIRDSHARINGDEAQHEMPSGGLDIIAEDGRALFSVSITKDGNLYVNASGHCKHGGHVLEDILLVKPRASNAIEVIRSKYK